MRNKNLSPLLLIGTTLLLNACGQTTPHTPPTPIKTVSGTLSPVPTGTAKIQLKDMLGTLAAEGTVDSKGNFTLTLPEDGSDLFSSDPVPSSTGGNCTGSVSKSNPAAKISVVRPYLQEQTSKPMITTNAAGTSSYSLMYASEAVKFSGSFQCETNTLQVNLDFPKGWSVMEMTLSATGASYKTSELPTDAKWIVQ